MQDGRPFAFAGLWESWDKGGEGSSAPARSSPPGPTPCSRGIHDRMPVILPPDAYDAWLDPDADREELGELADPLPRRRPGDLPGEPLRQQPAQQRRALHRAGRLSLEVRADVREALREGAPVVALESTLISHGLPRPDNLEVAREAERAVRAEGAVPATIGVIGGMAKVGLEEAELELMATAEDIPKLSARDLPVAVAKGSHGATTVAATAHLAALAGHTGSSPRGASAACTGRRARAGTSPRTSRPSHGRPWPWSAPGSSPSSTFPRPWSTWRPSACPSWDSARYASPASTSPTRGARSTGPWTTRRRRRV